MTMNAEVSGLRLEMFATEHSQSYLRAAYNEQTTQGIRGFLNDMCYTNSRFICLLTYLLTYLPPLLATSQFHQHDWKT